MSRYRQQGRWLRVEGDAFARQVSAWLDPFKVIEAARLYSTSPKLAQLPTSWAWASPHYDSARDVGLDLLVTAFVENFRLAPQYVRLLRLSWEEPIPAEAWDWLLSLSFSGELSFTDVPEDTREGTVAWLSDRFAMVSILGSPLTFLGEIVGRYAPTWRSFAPQQADDDAPGVWLEHSSPAVLFVYIESIVARACGIEPSVPVPQSKIRLPTAVCDSLGCRRPTI
jgi:hypothetical protein